MARNGTQPTQSARLHGLERGGSVGSVCDFAGPRRVLLEGGVKLCRAVLCFALRPSRVQHCKVPGARGRGERGEERGDDPNLAQEASRASSRQALDLHFAVLCGTAGSVLRCIFGRLTHSPVQVVAL